MSTQIPAAGTYAFDPSHSTVEAVAKHLMVTKVRGRFTDVTGTITVAEKIEDSKVEAVIRTASLDSGNAERDAHLTSPDFLDVETYPEIRFVSTTVERTGDDDLRITGDLTIRGITQPITLDAEYEGAVTDPWGGARVALSVRGELERERWGMNWNVALETGGVLVSKTFKLDFAIQAVLAANEATEPSEAVA